MDNQIQNTQERFSIGPNKTKRAYFRGSPLYQATYNMKTEKQTIDSLSLRQLDAGRLAEGKETAFFRRLAVKSVSDFFHGQ